MIKRLLIYSSIFLFPIVALGSENVNTGEIDQKLDAMLAVLRQGPQQVPNPQPVAVPVQQQNNPVQAQQPVQNPQQQPAPVARQVPQVLPIGPQQIQPNNNPAPAQNPQNRIQQPLPAQTFRDKLIYAARYTPLIGGAAYLYSGKFNQPDMPAERILQIFKSKNHETAINIITLCGLGTTYLGYTLLDTYFRDTYDNDKIKDPIVHPIRNKITTIHDLLVPLNIYMLYGNTINSLMRGIWNKSCTQGLAISAQKPEQIAQDIHTLKSSVPSFIQAACTTGGRAIFTGLGYAATWQIYQLYKRLCEFISHKDFEKSVFMRGWSSTLFTAHAIFVPFHAYQLFANTINPLVRNAVYKTAIVGTAISAPANIPNIYTHPKIAGHATLG